MTSEQYENIVTKLVKEFDLIADKTEHEAITEFYEGVLPTFKLILAAGETENESALIISFHVDVDAPSAIQWFLRVKALEPILYLSGSYMCDSYGVCYVGEEAEILKRYMLEQEILASVTGGTAAPGLSVKKPSVQNYSEALIAFHKLDKKKGDTAH